jgi:hypothetical protein
VIVGFCIISNLRDWVRHWEGKGRGKEGGKEEKGGAGRAAREREGKGGAGRGKKEKGGAGRGKDGRERQRIRTRSDKKIRLEFHHPGPTEFGSGGIK